MRIDILTLFPDTVGDMMNESILGRAQERGYIRIETHQIRDYTTNKQNQVDDYPYGGGRGAVMQADPLYNCWCHACDEAGGPVHTIYLSPCGHVFTQADAKTGGEIPAMAVADSVCRLVPGVLSDSECFEDESHWAGTLEYPQYSRPAVWHGREVPPILLSGDHARVARWRRKQSLLRTRARRPDMYEKLVFETKEDLKILKEMAEDEKARAASAVDPRE